MMTYKAIRRSTICLTKCLQPTNVCHNITTRGPPPRRMKHTLYTRHRTTVEPLMTDGNLKDTLKSIHTTVVNKQKNNRVLNDGTLSGSNNKANHPRRQRTTLSQLRILRSGHCKLLGQYKKSIGKDATGCCTDCGASPQDVLYLFNCPTHPTRLKPPDIWNNP